MKQSHEERSKLEFDKLARIIFPSSELIWEDVKNDPPDWYLTIDNVRYAVEATTIVEVLASTGVELSSFDVSASLHRFVKSVEKSAIREGVLNGTYVVTLCPIPNFAQYRRKLRHDLIGYIRETQELPSGEAYTIGYVRHHRITIRKLNDTVNFVTAFIVFDGKRGDDAQQDLTRFISQALSEKADKLRHVTNPIILLLLDSYHYSFVADWNAAIYSCDNRVRFDVICRVLTKEPSKILWSRSSKWS